MSRSLLTLALLGGLALLPAVEALALDQGAARKAAGQQAVPFGGAYSPTQVGKRPQDLLASGPDRVIEAAMDEVQEIAHG